MNKHIKTKFIIYDEVTSEYLISYSDGYDLWDHIDYDINANAIFESAVEAAKVIDELTASFLESAAAAEINFVIKEYHVGDSLYEDVRKLITSYDGVTREYDDGHTVTSSIADLLRRQPEFVKKTDKSDEDKSGICDACRNHVDDLFIINTPTLAGIAICKSCRGKEKVVKKRLYSRLSQLGIHIGNDKFYGGQLNLFGIPISIDWNSDGFWELYSPDALTSAHVSEALEGLDKALSPNNSILVFGDEDTKIFAEITNLPKFVSGKEFFWSEDGKKWRLGKLCTSSGELETLVSIEVDASNRNTPTGVVMQFDDADMVYIYTKEGSE